jgi:hypothetical protein
MGIGVLFYYGWTAGWAPLAGGAPSGGTPSAPYPPLPMARADARGIPTEAPRREGETLASLPWPPDIASVSPVPLSRTGAPTPAAVGSPRPASHSSLSSPPRDAALVVESEPPLDEPGPAAALQRRAVVELTPRVVALAVLGDAMALQMRRYVEACRPGLVATLPADDAARDWPVPLLLDARLAALSPEDPTGCADRWDRVVGSADRLASGLGEMHELARAQGVLPGHVREALEEYALSGWERYPRPR